MIHRKDFNGAMQEKSVDKMNIAYSYFAFSNHPTPKNAVRFRVKINITAEFHRVLLKFVVHVCAV